MEEIPKETALAFLQNVRATDEIPREDVQEMAEEISFYDPPSPTQAARHRAVNQAVADCMTTLVLNTAPSPERSKAISALREARMWANAGIAQARDEELSAAVSPHE